MVSFDPNAPPHCLIPVADEIEIRERWYNKRDYLAIKMSVVSDLNRIAANGNHNSHDGFCERGLELMTPGALVHRKQIKMRVLAAVWNGQVKQWNEQDKIHDPEAIAIAYQKETLECVNLARNFGIMDEQVARDEYIALFASQQGVIADHHETMGDSSTMTLTPIARLGATVA